MINKDVKDWPRGGKQINHRQDCQSAPLGQKASPSGATKREFSK
jgi:hypothetical protein